MREIYNFLEKPYYHHDFNNINYSNENFDRFCNLKDLHTVRKKIEYKPQKWIIPPEIVKKYQKFNMEFWKRPYIDSFEETNETNEKNIKYK
jgi:sulfotransferase